MGDDFEAAMLARIEELNRTALYAEAKRQQERMRSGSIEEHFVSALFHRSMEHIKSPPEWAD